MASDLHSHLNEFHYHCPGNQSLDPGHGYGPWKKILQNQLAALQTFPEKHKQEEAGRLQKPGCGESTRSDRCLRVST